MADPWYRGAVSSTIKMVDNLNRLQYPISNTLRRFTDPDNDYTMADYGQGITDGLALKERSSTADTFDNLGWYPVTGVGKAAKFGASLLGDIFTDPLTYTTFGGKTVASLTGKLIPRGTKVLKNVANTSDDITNFGSQFLKNVLPETAKTISGFDDITPNGITIADRMLVKQPQNPVFRKSLGDQFLQGDRTALQIRPPFMDVTRHGIDVTPDFVNRGIGHGLNAVGQVVDDYIVPNAQGLISAFNISGDGIKQAKSTARGLAKHTLNQNRTLIENTPETIKGVKKVGAIEVLGTKMDKNALNEVLDSAKNADEAVKMVTDNLQQYRYSAPHTFTPAATVNNDWYSINGTPNLFSRAAQNTKNIPTTIAEKTQHIINEAVKTAINVEEGELIQNIANSVFKNANDFSETSKITQFVKDLRGMGINIDFPAVIQRLDDTGNLVGDLTISATHGQNRLEPIADLIREAYNNPQTRTEVGNALEKMQGLQRSAMDSGIISPENYAKRMNEEGLAYLPHEAVVVNRKGIMETPTSMKRISHRGQSIDESFQGIINEDVAQTLRNLDENYENLFQSIQQNKNPIEFNSDFDKLNRWWADTISKHISKSDFLTTMIADSKPFIKPYGNIEDVLNTSIDLMAKNPNADLLKAVGQRDLHKNTNISQIYNNLVKDSPDLIINGKKLRDVSKVEFTEVYNSAVKETNLAINQAAIYGNLNKHPDFIEGVLEANIAPNILAGLSDVAKKNKILDMINDGSIIDFLPYLDDTAENVNNIRNNIQTLQYHRSVGAAAAGFSDPASPNFINNIDVNSKMQDVINKGLSSPINSTRFAFDPLKAGADVPDNFVKLSSVVNTEGQLKTTWGRLQRNSDLNKVYNETLAKERIVPISDVTLIKDFFKTGRNPNAFRRGFNHVMNRIKPVLLSSPSTFTANQYGNASALAIGGQSLADPRTVTDTIEAGFIVAARNNPDKLSKMLINIRGKDVPASEIMDVFVKSGADGGLFASEFLSDVPLNTLGTKEFSSIPGKALNMIDKVPAFLGKTTRASFDYSETMFKLTHFISRLRKGDDAKAAAASTFRFFYDYGDLSNFEQTYSQAAFPFYTWSRKNIPAQVLNAAKMPSYVSFPAKQHNVGMAMADDELNSPPEIGFNRPIRAPFLGKNATLSTQRMMPQSDLEIFSSLFYPEEGQSRFRSIYNKAAEALNPLLKTPLESVIGRRLNTLEEMDNRPFKAFNTIPLGGGIGRDIFGMLKPLPNIDKIYKALNYEDTVRAGQEAGVKPTLNQQLVNELLAININEASKVSELKKQRTALTKERDNIRKEQYGQNDIEGIREVQERMKEKQLEIDDLSKNIRNYGEEGLTIRQQQMIRDGRASVDDFIKPQKQTLTERQKRINRARASLKRAENLRKRRSR